MSANSLDCVVKVIGYVADWGIWIGVWIENESENAIGIGMMMACFEWVVLLRI